MTAEKLMDAMNYLPEDLLLKTDALRQKKRFRWKPLVAAAACLCFVMGLWFLNPGLKAAESTGGMDTGNLSDDAGTVIEQSGSTTGIKAKVYQVYEDYILVTLVYENGFDNGIPKNVSLENLEQIPKFEAGQIIIIYTQQSADSEELKPYKIIIEEE